MKKSKIVWQIHNPIPNRFRSKADALKFQETRNFSLCVVPYIAKNGCIIMNPKYKSARYEEAVLVKNPSEAMKMACKKMKFSDGKILPA